MTFASRMSRVRPSAIRELLKYGEDPSITSFGGGYPDPDLLPKDALLAAYQRALTKNPQSTLQYSASAGLLDLRELIAEQMAADGTECAADEVLVLQGAQQGLDLVAKMLIDPGDLIATEDPTFLGALISFNAYEPRYLPIESDDEGLRVDRLEEALRGGARPKLVYIVPDFSNPTGKTLSLARRRALVALAEQFDFLILEDSPYRALRYEGAALPTIMSLDTRGRVIRLGSFSKILAPALRVGWAVADRELIERLGLLKLAADTQCSTINMRAVVEMYGEFDVAAHVRFMSDVYRHKRDLMLSTMQEAFPASVRFSRPEGGGSSPGWSSPRGFDAAEFMIKSAIPRAKVAYVPGAAFFPGEERPHFARFSYSGVPDQQMHDALRRLGALLNAELGKSAHSASQRRSVEK